MRVRIDKYLQPILTMIFGDIVEIFLLLLLLQKVLTYDNFMKYR